MEATKPSINKGPRRSTRERKKVVKYQTVSGNGKRRVTWTKNEKVQLLEGLKKVGDHDFQALRQFVPSKKPSQINYFINSLKQKLPEYMKSWEPDQLDDWAQRCKQLAGETPRHKYDALPIAMLLVVLFENDQGVEGDADFRSLYEYLFAEMAELPRPKLNEKTKSILFWALADIQNSLKNLSPELLKVMHRSPQPEKWPFSSPVINPLKFPEINLDTLFI